jgi:ribosomal protein L11 methyltransferase
MLFSCDLLNPNICPLNYVELKIKVKSDFSEILLAELADSGYDSFVESEEGLEAYIEEDKFKEEDLRKVIDKYINVFSIDYSVHKLENKNWNEEWEKNFSPVLVADKCFIRASFHKPEPKYPYDIIINPKMSFGTGHHETTSMMIENQLETDHQGKKIMDAGSGTGILSIMASKLGAESIMAFDVEDWAFENLKENIQLNHCTNIHLGLGNIFEVKHHCKQYDIVLANINKNVLLEEIQTYSLKLVRGGVLMLSGFYLEDADDIVEEARRFSLEKKVLKEKNRWASLIFEKK